MPERARGLTSVYLKRAPPRNVLQSATLRRRPMKKFSFLLCLSLLTPALAGAQQPSTRPLHQKLKPCKIQGIQEEVLCGTMPVWENRTAKSGRKIDLYMVVLPAQSPNPAPDPVFYLSGG